MLCNKCTLKLIIYRIGHIAESEITCSRQLLNIMKTADTVVSQVLVFRRKFENIYTVDSG